MITLQLLESIMSERPDADANYIYERLKEAEDVKSQVRALTKEREKEDTRHAQALKEIESRIRESQARCKHWSRTYHPDPSGNSDSFYECDTCQKYM